VLKEVDDTVLGSTDKFLSSRLRFTVDVHGQEICLLQSNDIEIGVMMGWEREISAFRFLLMQMGVACSRAGVSQVQETVHKMCDDHPNAETGLRVLNVGFGLGIVGSICLGCLLWRLIKLLPG
jgi:type IV protein arginine methyltransferase